MKKYSIILSTLFLFVLCSAFVWKVKPAKIEKEKSFDDLKTLFFKGKTYELAKTDFLEKNDKTARRNAANKLLTNDFKHFLPYLTKSSQFSRVPEYFAPVQMIESERMIAFIYRKSRGFGNIMYDDFFVSVLNEKGESIHHEAINEGKKSGEVVALRIDEKLQLEKKVFTVEYPDDVKTAPKPTFKLKTQKTVDLTVLRPFENNNPSDKKLEKMLKKEPEAVPVKAAESSRAEP